MDKNGGRRVAGTISAPGIATVMITLQLVYILLLENLALLGLSDAQLTVDAEGLLAFKAEADGSNIAFQSWVGNDCCNSTAAWAGITCKRSRVTEVKLDHVNLRGTFPENSLSKLSELKLLVLSFNQLTGEIPDLRKCTNLEQLWLQENEFSGPIPNFLINARKLVRLDLSNNKLVGPIPDLSGLPSLISLDVNHNNLTGSLPSLSNPKLNSFNVSNNPLFGPVPQALLDKNFSADSYSSTGLCGGPSLAFCSESRLSLPPSPAPGVVGHKKQQKLSTPAVIAIVIGDTLVLILLTVIFLVYYWRKYSKDGDDKPASKTGDVKSSMDSQSSAQFATLRDPDENMSKLVFFDSSHARFELEDLLRASAEMLGKGSFGTAYKAVLDSGMIVAVKRLRDLKDVSRTDFEQHMQLLGKLKHPNLVTLTAYYYAKEEKLLVYEYMANGNLFSMLHGNRGSGRTPIDWISRLRIAHEVAVGLAYLHQECESQKFFHGNIKSSNIMVGKNFEICISDVGLVGLMNPTVAAQRMAGYRAPEYSHTKRITSKADVYSFGVLLLELLTGRQPAQLQQQGQGGELNLPKWVHSVVREEWTAEVFDLELKSFRHGEDEMVTLLQIAMACVTENPEQRPRMPQVVKLIEEIRVDSFEPSESFESHSEDFAGHDSPFNL